MLDKTLEGYFSPALTYSIKVDPVVYTYAQLENLDGPFQGHIKGGYVVIEYEDSDATITGKARGDYIPDYLEFEGKTDLLGY